MSIDASVGGASSDSYATVAEGNTYFAGRMYATNWTAASDGNKEKALVSATARVDEERFKGTKTSPTQALKFPRSGITLDGDSISSSIIPAQIKAAVFEIANDLLGSNTLAESGLNQFTKLVIGPIELDMNQPIIAGALPDRVSRLLSGFIRCLSVAGVFGGGISNADKLARESDTDRPKPAFTANLHQSCE